MGCGHSQSTHNVDVDKRTLPLPSPPLILPPLKDCQPKLEESKFEGESPPPKYCREDPNDLRENDLQEYFIQFPTPSLLREANRKYGERKQPPLRTHDGELLPYPVSTSKTSVFVQSEYEQVDLFASQMEPKLYTETLEKFTNLLTCKYKGDEMSTTRVIFRWLATQDIHQIRDITSNDDSVISHLKTLDQSPGYYSEFFIKMCRFAGLKVKIIRGYVKHAHLEPGDTPALDDLNSWVAVAINDEWRLVDPHWGSSHMVGEDPGEWLLIDDNGQGGKTMEKQSEQMVYVCNEVYFLTDPEQFIYSHIPAEDEDMQLLARPVTLGEFVEMAYLKPPFFDLDLQLLEHRKCVLNSSDGEIDIRIGIPSGKRRSFMYRLWVSNQERVENVRLERFCIMQQKNEKLFCRIYFPTTGKFLLELFARDTDVEGNYCRLICKFIIHCDSPAEGVKAFPENERREWGPGPDLMASGLHALSHEEALIEAIDGTVEVRFRSIGDAVNILHHLHSNGKTKEQLKRHVVHYADDVNHEVVLLITLPDAGEYALNIFADNKAADGKYSNVCSYILSTEKAAPDVSLYPELANGRIGSLLEQSGLSLRLLSHESPVIRCLETGELELVFESSLPCETITSLEFQLSDGGVRDLKDYVWPTYKDRKISYRIRFPECGMYALKVFAKPLGTDGSYPHVYTCLLHVAIPMETCVQFPSSFIQWKPDCNILEPTVNVLAANSKVTFEVDVPEACNMSVIDAENNWTTLEKIRDNIWKADVDTGCPGELRLCGQLEEESDTYLTLLSYTVAGESDLQMEVKKQQLIQEEAKKNNDLKKEERRIEEEERNMMFEKYKQALTDAIQQRHLPSLRDALKAIERKKYVSRLQSLVEEGRDMIHSLKRILKLKQAILKMDQNTMLEIKNYQNPPKGVHEVMISTLLILGDTEKATKMWTDCQKCLVTIGKDGLFRRVTNFDLTALNPEIAARALQIVGKFRLDDIRVSSAGVAVFYSWTTGMIDELYSTDSVAKDAKPANLARQKQILDVLQPRHSIKSIQ